MRFASFFSLALAAATASLAVAHPVYDSMLTARAEDDLSLSARELAILDLLRREYLMDDDFGLSRRDGADVVDLLRREYLAAGLFARGGEGESKQPDRSAMKGGREAQGIPDKNRKVTFHNKELVHQYSNKKPAAHRGKDELRSV